MPRINEDLHGTRLEYAEASNGIRDPGVTILMPGEDLYRFASSVNPGSRRKVPIQAQIERGWWFRSRDWQKILKSYLSGALNLGTVARIAGAVQWSWSNMDVLVKARVLSEIEAWEGFGRPQYRDILPNGMAVTLRGFPDVVQLYIPGMRSGAAAALRIVDWLEVTSTDKFGNARVAAWGH
jgi:hypothetical protein